VVVGLTLLVVLFGRTVVVVPAMLVVVVPMTEVVPVPLPPVLVVVESGLVVVLAGTVVVVAAPLIQTGVPVSRLIGGQLLADAHTFGFPDVSVVLKLAPQGSQVALMVLYQ
jgi:hypothetical protein